MPLSAKLAEFEWTKQVLKVVAQTQNQNLWVAVCCQKALGVRASCGLFAEWWVGGYCSDLLKKSQKKNQQKKKRDKRIPAADELAPLEARVVEVGLSVGNSNCI
jgi:hypothetical protein